MNEAIALYNSSLDYAGFGGRKRDDGIAFELNERAAELGHADAILSMGWFYLNGYGVARDLRMAQHWYRRSARRGNPSAMFSLGYIAYIMGGYSEARRWFERASKHGHQRSLYWLGKLAWRGHGIAHSRSVAFDYFHRAARGRDPEAIRVLRYVSRRARNI